MKVFELAKELNLKCDVLVTKAKSLGINVKFASMLKPEDEKTLRGEYLEKNNVGLTAVDKQGSLIGLVHTGEKLISVCLRLTYDQLKKFNFEVLGEHNTVFGGQIELNKKIQQKINDKTVKIFNKE